MKKGFTTFSFHERGFTLVELLVVVSIIAILSVIGMAVYTGILNKAREAKVKGDLDAFYKAYELKFNAATGQYPAELTADDFVGGIPVQLDGSDYPGCTGGRNGPCNLLAGIYDEPFEMCVKLYSGENYCKKSVRITRGTVTGIPILADLSSGGGGTSPSPTASPTASPSPSASPTASASPSPTASPTAAPCASVSHSAAPTSCSTVSPLCEGLVAYWKMDEPGGVRVDATGRGNILTPTGTLCATSTGIQGYAAGNFRSAGQALQREDNPDVSLNGDKTFAFWIYYRGADLNDTTATVNQYVIYKTEPPPGSGVWRTEYYFLINSNFSQHIMSFHIAKSDGTFCRVGPLAVPLDSWKFVVVWYNRGGNQVGMQAGTGTALGTPLTADCVGEVRDLTGPFTVGGWQISVTPLRIQNRLDGYIDELGIWNKVLSNEEKTNLFNSGRGMSLSP